MNNPFLSLQSDLLVLLGAALMVDLDDMKGPLRRAVSGVRSRGPMVSSCMVISFRFFVSMVFFIAHITDMSQR